MLPFHGELKFLKISLLVWRYRVGLGRKFPEAGQFLQELNGIFDYSLLEHADYNTRVSLIDSYYNKIMS